MRKLIIIVFLLSLLLSCSVTRWDVADEEYAVTLYSSDGDTIGHWETRGKMYRSFEGYCFMDKETNKFTEIVGTIVVKQK